MTDYIYTPPPERMCPRSRDLFRFWEMW